METKDGVKAIEAKSPGEWRKWLEKNHEIEKSVWLIIYKKESGFTSVYYPEAVDEALCFGWVDSKPNKRDDHSFYQFFARRNPKSNWSKNNKEKVERLIQEGKMASSGLAMIEEAKRSGTWDELNEVEALILPKDLEEALNKYPNASKNFESFPPSVRRAILEWILIAKRTETREKRIKETASLAEKNIRANQYRQ